MPDTIRPCFGEASRFPLAAGINLKSVADFPESHLCPRDFIGEAPSSYSKLTRHSLSTLP
jgi:hypothetical protein